LQVPESWWDDHDGDQLYSGTILALDFAKPRQCFFQFELDSERRAFYPMRYDAVFTFVDAEQDHFIDFRLPRRAVSNPEGEAVRIGRATSTSTSAENETSSEIEEEEDFNIYTRTDAKDWTCLKDGEMGRRVDPVPYTGEDKLFSVDITPEEVEKLKDTSGDI